MPSAKQVLLLALGVVTLVFIAAWVRAALRKREPALPGPLALAIGFVTNFFDTLGIGSFAPTTSLWKLEGAVRDERIPGTLNVGHALPTVVQAFIFIAIVEVEMTTLVGMIAAVGRRRVARRRASSPAGRAGACRSGWGSRCWRRRPSSRWPTCELFPAGGDTLGLQAPLLWAGLAGNFVLGALMTLGIGLYAPCMILVALLGMNPQAAFPIMMGSCAFLMPVGSLRFVRRAAATTCAPRSAWRSAAFPAVLLAAFIVKSLPLTALRWLVVVVVAVHGDRDAARCAQDRPSIRALRRSAPHLLEPIQVRLERLERRHALALVLDDVPLDAANRFGGRHDGRPIELV